MPVTNQLVEFTVQIVTKESADVQIVTKVSFDVEVNNIG